MHSLHSPQGYERYCTYFVTQVPLKHTIPDFWQMIAEYDSRVIVLCDKDTEQVRDVKCASTYMYAVVCCCWMGRVGRV